MKIKNVLEVVIGVAVAAAAAVVMLLAAVRVVVIVVALSIKGVAIWNVVGTS